MLIQPKKLKNQYFHLADEVLEDFLKIANLAKKKCGFCFRSFHNGTFIFKNDSETMYLCGVCIIKVALSENFHDGNLMREMDLTKIIDLITKVLSRSN